jgi:hypothetical protein
MSVRYVDHPAETSINPNTDWFPLWDTSAGSADKCTVNNMIAGATLPGANLPAGSVPLAKLADIAASTLMGRNSSGAGAPEVITLSAGLSISAGGVLSLSASYQPLDSDLTAIAALTTQAYGRSLLTVANAATLREEAQLLTPTGWGASDKLVVTHLGDLLADVGALGALAIRPVTTATNADIQIWSKGTGSIILSDASSTTTLTMSQTAVAFDGAAVAINNTDEAELIGLGALVVLGGIRAYKRVVGKGLTTTTGETILLYNPLNDNAVSIDNVGGAGVGVMRLNAGGVGNGVLVTSATNATSEITGAFRVAGGVGIGGHLYLGPGDVVHILTDGSARFAGGNFLISADGALDINGGTFTVDEDGHVTTDGIMAIEPQYISLGPGATTFTATSSVVVLTGDGGGNTIGLIAHPGHEGMLLDIFFVDGLVTITDTAALTANSVNLASTTTFTANDMLSLRLIGGKWYERGRSAN